MEEEQQIHRICRHEVGHLIIAREMGFTTYDLKVTYHPKGHHASSEIDLWTPHISDISSVIEYMQKRLMVLYAGAMAESFDRDGNYNGKHAINEWKNGGAMNDWAKIRELIQLLRNLKFPETTDPEQIDNQLNDIEYDICNRTGSC